MFSKTKKVLAALLTLTMVIGLLPTTVLADEVLPEAPTTVLADEVLPEAAPAAQTEELAVSAITVREYHVPYSAMTDIRAYCVAASGKDLSEFNCDIVKFNFNDSYWVLGGANGAQGCWSATPINVDRHQPADLASVEFTFRRVFKSIKVSIPASELSVVSYAKDPGLDFAEVTMRADAPEPTPMFNVTFDAQLPDGTGAEYAVISVEENAVIDEGALPENPVNGDRIFEGWFLQDAETAFDFTTPIIASMILFAHWKDPVAPPPVVTELDAQFFLRLDKTIVKEDGSTSYAGTYYTPTDKMHGKISGVGFVPGGEDTIKDGVLNSTDLKQLLETFKPIQDLIVDGPSAAELGAVLTEYFSVTKDEIAAGTVAVLWYVAKDCLSDAIRYHVDGVVYNTETGKPVPPQPVNYTVRHEYYTGDSDTADGTVEVSKTGIALETITPDALEKALTYEKKDYTYTSAVPANGFTLDGSGTQSITLRYHRDAPVPPVPDTFTLTYHYVVPAISGAVTAPAGVTVQAPRTEIISGGKTFMFGSPTYGTGEYDSTVYTFHGWYHTAECNTQIGNREAVGESQDVYGYWTKAEVIPPQPIASTYQVVHEYYLNGSFVGKTSGSVSGSVGDVITPVALEKVLTYGEKSYTYTSAAPADGFILDVSGTQSITLRYDRHEEVIPPVPGPDPDPVSTYHVTVRYLEVGTEKVLADNFATKSAPEDSAYDVTAETALAIPGYAISSVDGTPAGRLNQNLLITVWYAPEQVIPEPGIPTTDLPEPALPNIPEDKVPTTDLPATETSGDQVIVEEGTPTTNLPQTGTVAAPVSPQWTLGLLALFSSMAAAGLVVLTSRRREDEAE